MSATQKISYISQEVARKKKKISFPAKKFYFLFLFCFFFFKVPILQIHRKYSVYKHDKEVNDMENFFNKLSKTA